MQVFVYEHFTGGGACKLPIGMTASSLLTEAVAMICAVTADFAALTGVRVVTTRDNHLPPFHPQPCDVVEVENASAALDAFSDLSKQSDWTLLIAPETHGILLGLAQRVESIGGQLLSPRSNCIEVAASKQATADVLKHAKVPVADGTMLAANCLSSRFRFPVVIKPDDGCGSQGVRLIQDSADLHKIDAASPQRIEEYILGLPASVSVLCGPAGNHAVPACEQRLSTDGQFRYLGGRLPLPGELDQRARRLALCATAVLPATIGYLGVDLVLGNADDGSGDRIIEINPRLTTSYVGLRIASRTNLATAMLAVAEGRSPDLCFCDEPLEFTAAGEILT